MSIAGIDQQAYEDAHKRQDMLTKPRGSLGKLERIACWFAARQGKVVPDALKPHIAVFAGDHGVVDEGVSAYPSVVTGEMVKNFAAGGAAINVLARQAGAELSVIDVGTVVDLSGVAGVVHAKVRPGTANLAKESAMSAAECAAAIQAGRDAADRAIDGGANILVAGDMGIGNTTASACLICALAGHPAEVVVGYGTGVDDSGRARKVAVVKKALETLAERSQEEILQQVGGLEIAAMAGFYLQAATRGVPAVVDGFIASAAALAARVIEPAVVYWLLASHVSQENGHALALEELGLDPLIDLNMRLGEGSGAALVLPLLQSAIALHAGMATFESAGVTDKDG